MGNCLKSSRDNTKDNDTTDHFKNRSTKLKDYSHFFPEFTTCHVIKVYDGDTFWVEASLNNYCQCKTCKGPWKFNIRLNGYDAWELKKKKGKDAREALVKLLQNDNFTIKIHPIKEKYGRLLATVYNDRGEDIVPYLIKNGHGFVYDGKKKNSLNT